MIKLNKKRGKKKERKEKEWKKEKGQKEAEGGKNEDLILDFSLNIL